MRILLAFLASVVALAAAPGPALADGFFELAGGIAQPIADDDYDNGYDTHLQMGARFGSMSASKLGFEIGVNYSPLNDEFGSDEVSVHRFRATAGIRAAHPIGDDAVLVARLAGGIEHVRARWEVLGFEVEWDDTGPVIDPGLGFLIGGGGTRLGGFVGLPIAFHDGQEDNVDVDYTAIDLDVLFVLSIEL